MFNFCLFLINCCLRSGEVSIKTRVVPVLFNLSTKREHLRLLFFGFLVDLINSYIIETPITWTMYLNNIDTAEANTFDGIKAENIQETLSVQPEPLKYEGHSHHCCPHISCGLHSRGIAV